MNFGISKALAAAFKELKEYIEILGLEGNDLTDEALERKEIYFIQFRYTARSQRK